MTKEFKEIIAPFLFEGKEYCPQFLAFVDGWPTITYQNQWKLVEKLKISNEQIQVIKYGDNHITVLAGNQYQGRFFITITEINGKANVEFCEQVNVDVDVNGHLIPMARHGELLEEQQIINLFHEIKIGQRVYSKSASVWQMELNMALKNEDFEKAAEIRDAMSKQGIKVGVVGVRKNY